MTQQEFIVSLEEKGIVLSEKQIEQFEKYYERAEKLYYAQLKSNDTDSEMQLLENVYQQVRSGGWL